MTVAVPALDQSTDTEGSASTRTWDVILEIGALEEPVEEAFGQIVDVVVDSEGWIYTLDGQLRWRTELSDFHEMEIGQTSEGLMQYAPGPDGVTHYGVGLFVFPGKLAVVQLVREDHSRRTKSIGPEPVRSIEMRMLVLASGKKVTARSDMPLVLATRAKRLYTVRTDPYPVLAILRVRDGGGPER